MISENKFMDKLIAKVFNVEELLELLRFWFIFIFDNISEKLLTLTMIRYHGDYYLNVILEATFKTNNKLAWTNLTSR